MTFITWKVIFFPARSTLFVLQAVFYLELLSHCIREKKSIMHLKSISLVLLVWVLEYIDATIPESKISSILNNVTTPFLMKCAVPTGQYGDKAQQYC